MRILYCNDNLWQSGGTERVLTTKLNWLSAQDEIDVAVAICDNSKPPFFDLDIGVKMLILDGKQYKKSLKETLLDYDPDIIVAVAGKAVAALPGIKCRGKKVLEFHYTRNFLVNFVRGLHSIRLRSLHLLKMRWLQWQLARIARKYDRFVGLTSRDVSLWGSPKNMRYIYNPLSFRSDMKSVCMNKKIIAVGSFTPVKGMDRLITAFGEIANDYPEWSVDIYGSGQEKGFLKELIDKYNLSRQVTLHEPVKKISEKLLDASIYAFPSRSDGFGLVITEAMECGLPTVAMDCPCGPREILDENTGIIVPDGDIEAFSSALKRLMDDDSLRRKMGTAASERVKRFYPENIMPQWLELFEKLTTS